MLHSFSMLWEPELKEKKFLVRISNKVYVPVQFEHYEEVQAVEEYEARHKALDIFDERMKYEPFVRFKFQSTGLKKNEICAGDAVEIE